VFIGLAVLLLLSSRLVLRPFYEVATKLRSVLVIVVLIMTWLHLPGPDLQRAWSLNQICAVITSVFLVAGWAFRLGRTFCRSIVRRRPVPQVSVTAWRHHDVMRVRLQLARTWKIQPGQYLFLTLLDPQSRAVVQTHPFAIAWWEMARDGAATSGSDSRPLPPILQSIPTALDLCQDGHAVNDITERAQAERGADGRLPLQVWLLMSRRGGWARHLAQSCLGRVSTALVDGPYGTTPDLSRYGHVILFATGIGITAQMPFMKTLLYGARQHF
jgi:predicted ferric reductase